MQRSMKKYFTNPEIRISSMFLLFLMLLFLLLTIFIFELYSDNLKTGYIKTIGAVAVRAIEKNPELEKEIIPLITREISEKEAIEGSSLLRKYGLTEKLEDELFPYMNKVALKNNLTIVFLFIFITGILFILNYFQHSFFYERIRRITLSAKKVIDGEYDITINENKEGDFSKLFMSFHFMKDIIKNNMERLKKEKEFLVALLSDISHQLKTPLSSMIVYNDIMVNKELTKEQRQKFLLNNQSQLYRMQWLIQSLLKLAKLDAKAIEFQKEEQSLNETIQDAIEALESKALENEVKVIFKEKREIFFNHDRLWIEESLINIIKNAIEHTEKSGEISIRLEESLVYQKIIIEDTGEGIEEEDLPNIFKRFYKGKTSKKSDSVGIGLALAKSIVEAHNGIIEVESRRGVGTKFRVFFIKVST